ncbi:MAG: large-conductance mechanosensitive channel protein MscL [Ignavibacteriaceae bacterium]|nr:large-conductance mechanosensitive channel protein MscL [Ignavibacteriaceae bacterium]
MWKEFKAFAMKGNVIDMAVGIIIGAAFGTIVSSLVADIIMPPIGILLGSVDFKDIFILLKAGATTAPPYSTLADAQTAGAVTLNLGVFLNKLISFLIVAWAVFLLIKALARMQRKKDEVPAAPTTKECPYCASKVAIKATRCAFCTSELPAIG